MPSGPRAPGSSKVTPTVYLTVDMEEWFHILDCHGIGEPASWLAYESRIEANTHRLLDLFDLHEAKSTWFVLGWVAENYPNLVREVQRRGHGIGCHSHLHSLVWQQTPAAFRQETQLALRTLEATCGVPITMYRAPGFSITEATPWAFEVLADCGITTDASVFPGRHGHGGVVLKDAPRGPFDIPTPSGTLREYPMSLARLGPLDLAYAGGGYFRLLPWPLIRRYIHANPYTMTYFHPRDFDPGQPRIPNLGLGRTIKSYVGLAQSLAKLNQLIQYHPAQAIPAV